MLESSLYFLFQPISQFLSLWPPQLLILICLCVWFALETRCDTLANGTWTSVEKQQGLKHKANAEVGVLTAWELLSQMHETFGRYSCCGRDVQVKQHVSLFFEIAKLFCVKFSDTVVSAWHPASEKICVSVEGCQDFKQLKTWPLKGKYQYQQIISNGIK